MNSPNFNKHNNTITLHKY